MNDERKSNEKELRLTVAISVLKPLVAYSEAWVGGLLGGSVLGGVGRRRG